LVWLSPIQILALDHRIPTEITTITIMESMGKAITMGNLNTTMQRNKIQLETVHLQEELKLTTA